MKYSALTLTFLLPFLSFGQDRFVDGYIVSQKNDTIRGLIEERTSYFWIEELRYKKAGSDDVLIMPLNGLKSFFIASPEELFAVANVDVDTKPIHNGELEDVITKRIVHMTIPMNVLVDGTVRLLAYRDKSRRTHFFFQQGATTTELNYVRYLRNNGVAEFEEYKQQLKNLFSDCSAMANCGTSLSESALVKLFHDYNQCKGSRVSIRKRPNLRLIPSLVVGTTYNALSYSGTDEQYFRLHWASEYAYQPSINITAGGSFRLVSAVKRNPLFVGADVLWNQTGTVSSSNTPSTATYHFNVSSVSLTAIAGYLLPVKGRLKPYVTVGFGEGRLLTFESSVVGLSPITNRVETYSPLIHVNSFGWNYSGAFGCSLDRLSAEVKYQHSTWDGDGRPGTVHVGAFAFLLRFALRK